MAQEIKAITDPRKVPDKATFPAAFLVRLAMVMFCAQYRSRRQFTRDLVAAGSGLAAAIWQQQGKTYNDSCHGDTMNNFLEILPPRVLERIIHANFRHLLKSRVLDRFRYGGKVTIAVDGTQIMRSSTQHCPHCLCTKHTSGVTTYSHHVPAAKLVTTCGLIVPVAVAFIDNTPERTDDNPDSEKKPNRQDCELKAWRRLLADLRTLFPRLKIVLLADGLYAEETTFRLCDEAGWDFIISLPDDKIPSIRDQLPSDATKRKINNKKWTGTRKRLITKGNAEVSQAVRWRSAVSYRDGIYHVIELEEVNEKAERIYFNRWILNVRPDTYNAFDLAAVGRLRWKIENEGTNTPKNCGYEMEHIFGKMDHAWKNYYLILQISQLLCDLVRFTDLIAKHTGCPKLSFRETFQTIRDFAERLRNDLRGFQTSRAGPALPDNMQVRFILRS